MSVELNHTIIWARDKVKSAAFLALPAGKQWGPFVPVQVSNGVTLDYADAADIQSQHYAFLLNEDEFDAALTRIQESGLAYYADPYHRHPGEINHNYGGRGVYVNDPDGHNMELMTAPYGAIPAR
ncbi:MAG: VOC family protein [Pseudonocardiaceae bacterium]